MTETAGNADSTIDQLTLCLLLLNLSTIALVQFQLLARARLDGSLETFPVEKLRAHLDATEHQLSHVAQWRATIEAAMARDALATMDCGRIQ